MINKYLYLFIFLGSSFIVKAQIFSTISGNISFISNAPLEIIEAQSDQLHGVLNLENKKFEFKMFIKSFDGFNNSMQKIHFYENYMETEKFPLTTFTGKILEPIELGKKIYRAKGMLVIHGEIVERIIEVEINLREEDLSFSAVFKVPLKDHDIDLPRLVTQKIAENIVVSVNGTMNLRK